MVRSAYSFSENGGAPFFEKQKTGDQSAVKQRALTGEILSLSSF
jgi:hypothetical protein